VRIVSVTVQEDEGADGQVLGGRGGGVNAFCECVSVVRRRDNCVAAACSINPSPSLPPVTSFELEADESCRVDHPSEYRFNY